jgi:hypothetical protein
VIDWNWLALACVYLCLWMGTTFTLIFSTGTGWLGGGWKRALNVLAGVIWVLMMTGSILFLMSGSSDQPFKTACVLVLGAVFSVAGWIFNERLVAGRIGFRPGTQPAGQKRGVVRLPGGYGGVARLISATFTRSISIGVVMMVFMGVFYGSVLFYSEWRR